VGGQHGQPLSTTTVRLVHRVLHKALADAVIEGVLAANPTDRVRPPRRRTAETPIWTAPQIRTFLTSAQDDPLFPAWLLALTCGLRRGELAGLRWQDVDLEAATLTIANQRTTDVSTQVVVKAPKGTSRRTLDLAPGAVAALRAHRTQQDADLAGFGLRREPGTLLFLREDGSPHLPARLTELLQAASRRAGLPVIRLHDARHSCATLALSAGIHPKVVQQLLGHASWSTTMDLYTHRVERLQRDATARIEALVQPGAATPSAGPAQNPLRRSTIPPGQTSLF
jgi:integrase